MKAKIERLSFFDAPGGGSLRFTEHFPADAPQEEHFECGCTKDAETRPTGTPHQCYLIIDYSDHLEGRDFSFRSWLPTELSMGFKWGAVVATPPGWTIKDNRPHFDFRYFTKKDLLDISQLTDPGEFYGSWDAANQLKRTETDLHFTLCFGKADVSEVFMGHSPPKIINIKQVAKDDLWTYTDGYGKEHVGFLPKGKEHAQWWDLRNDLQAVNTLLQAVHADPQRPLEELHRQATAEPVTAILKRQSKFLSETLNSLETTEFFKAGYAATQAKYAWMNR